MKLKIIITTTSSKDNAKKMAKSLVESKLSPCVQMIKNVKSTYRWNDEVKSEKEYSSINSDNINKIISASKPLVNAMFI